MIWKNLKEKLEKGIKGILLIVIESKGSSPGRAGFKMVVFEDGSLQ